MEEKHGNGLATIGKQSLLQVEPVELMGLQVQVDLAVHLAQVEHLAIHSYGKEAG
jgi:hypothetical protein